LVIAVVSFPRIVATAWDSARLLWGDLTNAFGDGSILEGLVGVVSLVALALPIVGIGYVLVRLTNRIASGAWKTAGRFRFGHAILGPMTATAAVGIALLWWPNGEYRPIQPGERGTLGDAVDVVGQLRTGRPALTPERAEELEGAPFRADGGPAPSSEQPPAENPDGTGPEQDTGSTTTTTDNGTGGTTTTTDPSTDSTTETTTP
jgi:putative peptide zinc metalloprotease protein